MNSIQSAQKDMRSAYFNSAPGVTVSALVWLLAAIMIHFFQVKTGIISLIIGGMMIHPISILVCKSLGRSGKHDNQNPLGLLAIETTIWMVLCILLAIGLAYFQTKLFFPAMILIIGGRYLTFSSLYGLRLYWILSVALILSAFIVLVLKAPESIAALTASLIEAVFAVILFRIKPN